MEVGGQLHALSALLPRNESPTATEREAGWDPEPVSTRWWREKSPSLQGIKPRSSSLVTILI